MIYENTSSFASESNHSGLLSLDKRGERDQLRPTPAAQDASTLG